MDLTLRQLRMLREVAAGGSIAAAADTLGYTPSAVSQQLAALERTTGVAVLERIGRGVGLTDAGRALVRHADVVLTQVEQAQAALEEAGTDACGEVRLAVFESFVASLMPHLIHRLRADAPGVRLRTVELDPDDALVGLTTGRMDLALVLDYPHAPAPRPKGLERRVLRRERFRLAVPDDDPITGPVDLGDLADRPFIAGAMSGSCGRCTVIACRDAGFEPDIVHEIDKSSAALRLVAAGAGVMLLPDLALADPPPGVRLLELVQPVERSIELAVRPASLERPSLRAVIDAIDAVVGSESTSNRSEGGSTDPVPVSV